MGKMNKGKYYFDTEAVSVVTPKATTLWFALQEVDDVRGTFGGDLVFTPDDLDKPLGKGKASLRQIIDDLIDASLEEYNDDNKKKAQRADKIKEHTDADGNETGNLIIACKTKDKPDIVDKYGKIDKNFDKELGNGSEVKAQLYLKPYFMQGKVGVTAYLSKVQVISIQEFGGGSNPFEDESGDDDMPEWDNNDTSSGDDNDDY